MTTTTLLDSGGDDDANFLADLIRRCRNGDSEARKLLIERFYEERGRTGERRSVDVPVLDEMLERLETVDKRQSEIVKMYLFGGLTLQRISGVLGVSERTVMRHWAMARAWLQSELALRP